MKILVLMPLSESHSHISMKIQNQLPDNVRENCFIMPAYIDYLLETKKVENSIYAISNALLSAQIVYKDAVEKNKDLIIFGNIDKTFTFDAIFNCQDLTEDLPYQDGRAEKIAELVKGTEVEYIAHELYTNDDSIMPLHNAVAIADFLTAYLDTDPHLEEIKLQYQDRLNLKLGDNDNGDNQA